MPKNVLFTCTLCAGYGPGNPSPGAALCIAESPSTTGRFTSSVDGNRSNNRRTPSGPVYPTPARLSDDSARVRAELERIFWDDYTHLLRASGFLPVSLDRPSMNGAVQEVGPTPALGSRRMAPGRSAPARLWEWPRPRFPAVSPQGSANGSRVGRMTGPAGAAPPKARLSSSRTPRATEWQVTA